MSPFRRLQPFRYLHSCSGCFRLERLPGGICTHWKTPPCHGAHPLRTFTRSRRSYKPFRIARSRSSFRLINKVYSASVDHEIEIVDDAGIESFCSLNIGIPIFFVAPSDTSHPATIKGSSLHGINADCGVEVRNSFRIFLKRHVSLPPIRE